jgi:RNA-directed DNA polymerase
MTRFLETRLKLRVNQEKSAVDRPWKRVFLGYTVCQRKYNVRLRVASKSVQRLKAKLKMLFRSGRGRSIRTTIASLTPKLRGWVIYFCYAGAKGIFEDLDGWIRRHLRLILWRQWNRPLTRAKWLMRLGLSEVRACTSTCLICRVQSLRVRRSRHPEPKVGLGGLISTLEEDKKWGYVRN